MTAKEIQAYLIRERYMQSMMMPNYTPVKWWECDIFELTKAGYFREYEIKISRSDFRADAKKSRRIWTLESGWTTQEETKHARLARGDNGGPAQFWFVSNPGIIPLEEVPAWAGLIVFEPFPHKPTMIRPVVQKKAPRLHSQKADQTLKDDLMRTCYFRFQWLYCQNNRANQAIPLPPTNL